MTIDKPSGLRLFDTMTRQKKPFVPLEPGRVRMYVCGPTVYSDPHIGNFRTFIVGDVLRRRFDYLGYDVLHVMNITDIDDKTIRNSGKEGISLEEFTKRYTKSFFRGLDLMNIKRATTYPKATDYVPKMIEFIEELFKKNIAYEASDGVYFDIDRFPGYGKLSGVDVSNVQKTERMTKDEYDKDAVNDFVLWKKSAPEEEERGIFYESPWGRGRPGWHIECSVMTKSLCGDTLDIHAGGEDLTFPHHENEIAQSESLTGKEFVRNWIHVRHLMINGRSMSKSLGNYVSFDEVLSKYSADAFRYFYLSVHYRRPLDYTEQAMEIANNSLTRLENTLDLIDDAIRGEDTYFDLEEKDLTLLESVIQGKSRFENSMNDDLDTHGALDALHLISNAINSYLTSNVNKGVVIKISGIYRSLLNSLGFFETKGTRSDELTKELIEAIATVRELLRNEKRYDLSDMIRNELAKIGVVLSDTSGGTAWKIDKN